VKLTDIYHPNNRVERACRRYARSLMNGSNSRRGDGNIKEQVQRFQESSERYSLVNLKVRQLLNSYPIPHWCSLLYVNFTNHVTKIMDRYESRTRYYLVLESLNRWMAYGCQEKVLKQICRELLNYDVDKAAQEANAAP